MNVWKAGLIGLSVVSLAGVGCGDGAGGGTEAAAKAAPTAGSSSAASAREEQPKGDAKPWDPALGTATVTGVVRLAGAPPRRREVQMTADSKCTAQHTAPVMDETVIVGADGALANVFVSVKKGLESWKFPVPSEPVALDQKACLYAPHVLGVRVGQPLVTRNGDPLMHNVHVSSARNGDFNVSQPPESRDISKVFEVAEQMVKFKCDVHGWMSAHVGVVNHPYFAVTGADGAFTLTGLPAGEFTIDAWHEKYGRRSQTVKVGDRETAKVELEFKTE